MNLWGKRTVLLVRENNQAWKDNITFQSYLFTLQPGLGLAFLFAPIKLSDPGTLLQGILQDQYGSPTAFLIAENCPSSYAALVILGFIVLWPYRNRCCTVNGVVKIASLNKSKSLSKFSFPGLNSSSIEKERPIKRGSQFLLFYVVIYSLKLKRTATILSGNNIFHFCIRFIFIWTFTDLWCYKNFHTEKSKHYYFWKDQRKNKLHSLLSISVFFFFLIIILI